MSKGGRPSGFKAEFVAQAEKLTKIGATDEDIASFFEVNVRTLYRWKSENEEFCQALKRGKDVADNAVEERLFRRAMGYSHDAVKIFQVNGEALQVPYTEHYPPDTTAAIFWLKNRRPQQWRDVAKQEISGPDGRPMQHEVAPMSDMELARRIAFTLEAAAESAE